MQTRRNRPRGRCRKDRNRDTHKGADAKRLAGRRKKPEDACLLRQSLFTVISNPHHGLQSLCREDCSLCPGKTAVPVPGRLQSLSQEGRSPCPRKTAVPVPGTVSALSKPGPVQFPGNPRAFLQLFQTIESVHDGSARYHRPVVFEQVSVAVTDPFPEC